MSKTVRLPGPRLPWTTKLGYSAGNLSLGLMMNSLGFYLLLFYTDVIGLEGKLVGIALATGRLWDAFTDPAMGLLSDRTRSRFGRRRPYLLFGGPLFAAAFALLWLAPSGQSQLTAFVFLVLAQLLFTTMQTVVTVPYGALGAELTPDYHERNSVMAYQQVALMIGGVVGACMINLASLAGAWLNPTILFATPVDALGAFLSADAYGFGNGMGFRATALAMTPFLAGAYIITALATRENPAYQRRSSTPAFKAMLTTFKNRPFRLFIAAFLIATTAGQIGVFMFPYLVVHWLHVPQFMLPGTLLYTMTIILSIPLWRIIGCRFEKKTCYNMGLAWNTAVGLLFLVMVSPERPGSILVWAVMVGIGTAPGLLFPPSMLADIIDTDELESGLRREGSFMGVHSFVMKSATALGALWVGPGLDFAGYVPQADVQSDQTLLIMRLMYVLPCTTNLLVILVMARFPLTSKVMMEVRRAIDGKASLDATE